MCLRLLYGNKSSSFEKQFKQDKSVTTHSRNLHNISYGNVQSVSEYLLPFSVRFFIDVI